MSRKQSRLACVFPVAEEQAVDGHSRKQTPSYRAASSGCDDLIDLSDIGCADCSVDSLSNKSKVGGIPIDSVCLRNSHLMQTDGTVVCGGGDQTVTWATWGQATSWKDKRDPLCHPVHNRDVQGHPVPLTRGGHDTDVQGFQRPVMSVGYEGHTTSIPGHQLPVINVGSLTVNGRHKRQAVWPQTSSVPVRSADLGVSNMETDYVQPDKRHPAEQGSVNAGNDHWSPGKYGAVGGSEGQHKHSVDPPASQGSKGNHRIESDSLLQMIPNGQDCTVNTPFTMKDIMGEFRSHMNWSMTSSGLTSNSSEDSFFNSRTNPSMGIRIDEIPAKMQTEMKAVLSDCKLKSTIACEGIGDTGTPSNPHETLGGRDAAGEADVSQEASLMKMMSNMTLDGRHSHSQTANGVTCIDVFTTGNDKERKEYCLKVDESHAGIHSASHGDNTVESTTHSAHGIQSGRHLPVLDAADVTGVSRREMDRSERCRDETGRRETSRSKSGSNEMGRSERDKNVMGKSEKDQSELGTSEMDRKELGTSEMGRKELGTSEMGRKELGTSEMGRKELGKSEMGRKELGTSEMGRKESGTSEMGRKELGTSEMGRKELGTSEMGRKELGKSEMGRKESGKSKVGSSHLGKSEMGRSEIGEREFGKNKMGRSEPFRSEMGKSKMGRGEMGISETGLAQIDKIMKDVHRRGGSPKGIQDFDEIKTEKREQAERITDTEREQQHCAGAAEQIRSLSSPPLLEDPPHIQLEMDEWVKKDEFLNMESKYQPIKPASIMVEDCSDEDSSQFCKRPLPFEQTGGDTVTETVGQILLDEQRMPLARHLEKDIVLGTVDHMNTLVLPFGNAAGCSSLKRNQNLTVHRSGQDKSAMAVSINRSNNVQAVGNFNYNKNIYKVSTREGCHNIRTQSLREIASHEKLFVQTEAFHEVWKVSKEENVVFIVGPPGAGKTMIAKAVLLKLQKEQNFEPLILLSVQEMRETLNIDEKQGIFIKNTFGVSDFDQAKLNLVLEYFASVSVCVSGNNRFIFTCNNRIFTKCLPHLKLKKFFTASSVVDVQQVGGLTVSDKRTILYKHLKQCDVIFPDDLVEKIVNCANNSTLAFPKCCEIFTKSPYLHDQGKSVKFFQKPVLYYKLSAQLLWQKDDKSYFTVLLLVMVLGELQDSFLKGVLEDSFILKEARKVLDMLPYEVTSTQLESATQDLLNEGLYLKRSENNNSFIFIDSCVCDAVAIVFGTEYPKQLLQICSGEFLCERVLVHSQRQKENDEGYFQLGSDHFDFLSERFVTEIRSGSPYLVTRHQALGDGSFIKSFANYCETKTDINSILKSKDNLHQFPLLFWSSWNEKEHLFRWIFHEHKKRKLPISKEDIKRIARACCISGNVGALKIVFKVVKSSSDMVKDCATMSLAMPTCSEASLTVSPVEGAVQVGGLLHTACLHGHLPVVELLVTEYHSPVDLHDHYDNTPLTIAAKHGHANIVKFLIDQGAKANLWHPMRKMAIHEACENGRTEVVKVLLTAWPQLVDVIGPAPDLRFPIHYACASKEAQLVKLLVEKGAAPKCMDSTNNTTFHTACFRPGGLRVLKELKPTLQDLKLQNKFLATCLHLACEFGGPAMVEFLIKKGADVNALNNKQQTSLHVACQRNHVAIADKLLKNGADVFALDITGKPALKLTTHKKLQNLLTEQMNESDKVHQK